MESKKFNSVISSPLKPSDSVFRDKMFSSKRSSENLGMSLSVSIYSEERKGVRNRERERKRMQREEKLGRGEREKREGEERKG